MTSSNPILAGLQRLMRAGRPLDLLNLYKGVPIVYPAVVRELDETQAVVRVTGFELVCLTLEPTTILLSQMLEEAVSARVLAVDLPDQTARLGYFEYASSRVGDRMTVRVAPRETVDVAVEVGERVVAGQLADVSINGVGLHLPSAQTALIRPRAVVRLSLPLVEPSAAPATLSGTVRFVRPEGEVTRVGIVFAQDVQTLTILQYVRERQTEILDEIRALYQSRLTAN